MNRKKYHTVGTFLKYHTVGTFLKYHTVGTFPKWYIKIAERDKFDTPRTHIHELQCYREGNLKTKRKNYINASKNPVL